jgi:FemAB-related protein (PEP-CTERM system-associated)
MSTVCTLLEDATTPAWDAFVAGHPDATFFHQAAWRRVIERAFGHRTHYLMARRGADIVGVLPLAHVRSALFGQSLISVPFCVYGGPLATDAEALEALTEAANSVMAQTGVKVMEWRPLHALPESDAPGWETRGDLYVTFRRAITVDDDANMKAIPRKQRAMVRKGIDRGLSATIDRDLAGLHAIYSESVRNLGTPVFARRYFEILAETFPDSLDVLTVRDGQMPVAAVMNFYWRDEVIPYYGGGTAAARSCFANDFMYWEVMRHAAAKGCRMFDFGRSKAGTGAFSFKKNWGFTPQNLVYRYRLAPGSSIPDHNPLNPKYRLFIAAWKKLPVPLANLIGPYIVRGVG